MRTDQEILARAEAVKDHDWLGTQTWELVSRLPFDLAKSFLTDSAKEKDWPPAKRDADTIKAEMLDYMRFAWDKANNRRGISAGRSLDHMSAWLWLLGHDEAADAILDYDHYGKPWLRAICEAFEWDWRKWDDGRWSNSEERSGLAPPESVPALPLSATIAGGTYDSLA